MPRLARPTQLKGLPAGLRGSAGQAGSLRMVRLAALLALAVLSVLAVLIPAPAQAHVDVVFSDPAPNAVLATAPESIRLVFDDRIDDVGATVLLTGPEGRTVTTAVEVAPDSGSDALLATPRTDLGAGTWVASWRVVSSDGHPRAGTLTFSIGHTTPTPEAASGVRDGDRVVRGLLDVTTGLGDLALLLAAGLIGVAAAVPDLRGRRSARAGTASGLVAVVCAGIGVPLSGLYRLGLPLSALAEAGVWDTDLIGTDIARVLVLASALAAAAVAVGTGDHALAAVPAAVAVSTPAWSGHNQAADPSWLASFALLAHLAAAAIWLGGLAALVLADAAVRRRAAAPFARVATGALLVVAVEGVLAAWLVLGSVENLLSTTYGRLLLVKVALVLIAVSIAAGMRPGSAPSPRRLRTELGVLFAVPLVAGLLVNEPPEPPAAAAPAARSDSGSPSGSGSPYGSGSSESGSPSGSGPVAVAAEAGALSPVVRVGVPPREVELPAAGRTGPVGFTLDGRAGRQDVPQTAPKSAPQDAPQAPLQAAFLLRRDLGVLREVPLAGSPGGRWNGPARLPAGAYRLVVASGDALHLATARVPGRWTERPAGEPTTQARRGPVTVSLGGPLVAGTVRVGLSVTGAEEVRGALLATYDGSVAVLGVDAGGTSGPGSSTGSSTGSGAGSSPGAGLRLTGRLPRAGDGRLWVLLTRDGQPEAVGMDVTVQP